MCVVYLSFLFGNIWYDSFSLSKVTQRKYVRESIKSYFTTPKLLLDILFQTKHIVDFSSILGRSSNRKREGTNFLSNKEMEKRECLKNKSKKNCCWLLVLSILALHCKNIWCWMSDWSWRLDQKRKREPKRSKFYGFYLLMHLLLVLLQTIVGENGER